MSDADALLDAIWASPSNDTPRLVYADWLQEHGHEQYAQLIRLSCRIAREIQHPTERASLRLQRHLLRQAIKKAHPQAFPEIGPLLGSDDIPSIWHTVDADDFLRNWQRWWPYIRPKSLTLLGVSGHELELAHCEYLRRIVALECEGVVISGWGHRREEADWQPVNGILLMELARHQNVPSLTALKVEPIRVTGTELLGFADSSLSQRLDELQLWVQFPDGTRQDLHSAKGFMKKNITDFVTEHHQRFAQPV